MLKTDLYSAIKSEDSEARTQNKLKISESIAKFHAEKFPPVAQL